MPVSSAFRAGALVVTMEGGYASHDSGDVIIAGYSQPSFIHTTPVLIDARHSTSNRTSDDIWQTSRRLVRHRPAGHAGKWAIVVGEGPFRFALGRMGALTMESMGVP